MQQLTTTPFGRRPVTAGLMARLAANRQDAEFEVLDKWSLFRDLSAARKSFGLNDRALLVLNALLSFHPGKALENGAALVVFPSNQALTERAHGMAESTLRRHLATLVGAGLIARHDSPNGKRYARRSAGGEITRAFGFDLRPLLLRAAEIIRTAEDARAEADARRCLRERISLLKRDALKFAAYAQDRALPGPWSAILADLAQLHSCLRRKLPLGDLQQIEATLVDILSTIRQTLSPETEEMSGSDSENERHYQNSNKDSCESEQRTEIHATPATDRETPPQSSVCPDALDRAAPGFAKKTEPAAETATASPPVATQIPLPLVMEACPDILPYIDGPVRSWRDLIGAAGFVRGMMGISPSAWDDAQRTMGPEAAAVTIACILQRFATIRNPGGYLRSLTVRAANGLFSPGPMVMALLSTRNAVAA